MTHKPCVKHRKFVVVLAALPENSKASDVVIKSVGDSIQVNDGYVFEGGVKECVDVLREPPSDKANIQNKQYAYILFKTRYQ